MSPTQRRRSFLALAGAAGAVVVGVARPWRSLVEVRPPTLESALLSVLSDRAAAAAVGAAYLAVTPAEADRLLLLNRLAAALNVVASLPDAAALRARVAARVGQDFAAGATCSVDGWVLSRTEARLDALAAVSLD
jgi:hypothetical protein